MSTVQTAIWAKRQIENEKWQRDLGYGADGQEVRSVYLGSYMALDPCGRYHHALSENGSTARCAAFWESLERQLERRGLSLGSGEGDPTDIFAEEYREKSEDEDSEDSEEG